MLCQKVACSMPGRGKRTERCAISKNINLPKEVDTERAGSPALTSWPLRVAAFQLFVLSQPSVLCDKGLTKSPWCSDTQWPRSVTSFCIRLFDFPYKRTFMFIIAPATLALPVTSVVNEEAAPISAAKGLVQRAGLIL